MGRYTLFGINGNYYIDKDKNNNNGNEDDIKKEAIVPILQNPQNIKTKTKTDKKSILKQEKIQESNYSVTDILDLIPDIIHLSSNMEEDSDIITTATSVMNRRA